MVSRQPDFIVFQHQRPISITAAYRPRHSTEMALIKITNCVLMAAQSLSYSIIIVSDIAIFVLKRDVKL